MEYVFTFNEINYGRIKINADRKPERDEIIKKILDGEADYHNTDFTDFHLVDADGYMCCLHDTPRTFDWCEKNCVRHSSCDTVALVGDELKDE